MVKEIKTANNWPTNPREKRAYAHMAIDSAKKDPVNADLFKDAQEAVGAAGTSKKSLGSGFYGALTHLAENYTIIPDSKLWHDEDFPHKADTAADKLYEQYRLARKKIGRPEPFMRDDWLTVASPSDFIAPIETVVRYIPNMSLLDATEKALSAIYDWPNAAEQASDLARCIELGARNSLFSEVMQIITLYRRIVEKKPYGGVTAGFNLLHFPDEGDFQEAMMYKGKIDIPRVFENNIKALSDCASGKYVHCLKDYPLGPFFWLDVNGNFPNFSEDRKIEQLRYTLEKHYPGLYADPSLLRSLDIPYLRPYMSTLFEAKQEA
jgi:hypothetical protein